MIDAAVRAALNAKSDSAEFANQLRKNQEFQARMERAGVITRKQNFTIPLMERIVKSVG